MILDIRSENLEVRNCTMYKVECIMILDLRN